MKQEVKENMLKAAEYGNKEKKHMTKIMRTFFMAGIAAVIINLWMWDLNIQNSSVFDFFFGLTYGLELGVMILGLLYVTGKTEKLSAAKRRILNRQ